MKTEQFSRKAKAARDYQGIDKQLRNNLEAFANLNYLLRARGVGPPGGPLGKARTADTLKF